HEKATLAVNGPVTLVLTEQRRGHGLGSIDVTSDTSMLAYDLDNIETRR
ncbi:hypothetical protein FOTG_18117, partial [Fusarium oxysporum f. sp. vasinfectum 25433]